MTVPAVTVTPGAIRALAARYKFQSDRMAQAAADNNEKVLRMAMSAMSKIEEEAAVLGQTVEQLQAEPLSAHTVVTNGKLTPTNATIKPTGAGVTGAGPGSLNVSVKPKSVIEAERVAARAKAIAAEKVAGGQVPGSTRKAPRKPKGEQKIRPCLDGCGALVPGNFKMGHDAKLKSLILKVERGEEGVDSIPEIVQDLIVFKRGEKVENRDGKGKLISSTQEMVCTAAPVKFPGRPELKLTVRSD